MLGVARHDDGLEYALTGFAPFETMRGRCGRADLGGGAGPFCCLAPALASGPGSTPRAPKWPEGCKEGRREGRTMLARREAAITQTGSCAHGPRLILLGPCSPPSARVLLRAGVSYIQRDTPRSVHKKRRSRRNSVGSPDARRLEHLVGPRRRVEGEGEDARQQPDCREPDKEPIVPALFGEIHGHGREHRHARQDERHGPHRELVPLGHQVQEQIRHVCDKYRPSPPPPPRAASR